MILEFRSKYPEIILHARQISRPEQIRGQDGGLVKCLSLLTKGPQESQPK